MPTTTRQKLVEAATKRFYRDGFRNVGIDQLLADVGISKTAFYKHFECKEDLMLAALDNHDRWMQDVFRKMACRDGGEVGPARLRALFDLVEEFIGTEGFHGCIFVNASIEFPLPHDPAHVAAARNKQAIEDIVCEVAEAAGAPDPRGLAQELCLIMEGVYVTRHVTCNPETMAIARRMADAVIERHLAQPSHAS